MGDTKPKVDPDARTTADSLYAACLASPEHQSWRQEDLLALEIAPDVNTLMPAISLLMQENKFQPVQSEGMAAVFTVRGRSAASKYTLIKDSNAVSIYRQIENAGASGMWKQTLKKKLSLHENVVEKALKNLISTKHIKQLKAARNTAKKTYILYELEPAKDVTGGAWFSEGEIDYELIEVASQLVVKYIRKHSWMQGPRLPRLPSKKAAEEAKKKAGEKRKRDEHDNGEDSTAAKKVDVNGIGTHGDDQQSAAGAQENFDQFEEDSVRELRARAATEGGKILVPYPAGYADYPTATSILDYLDETGIIQKDLQLHDVKELLERLVYDGQLERMKSKAVKHERPRDESEVEEVSERQSRTAGRATSKTVGRLDEDDNDEVGFRWIRRPDSEWEGVGGDTYSFDLGVKMSKNGFSETPCSRCPVFKLCTEGGPVEAKSCEYLKEWF